MGGGCCWEFKDSAVGYDGREVLGLNSFGHHVESICVKVSPSDAPWEQSGRRPRRRSSGRASTEERTEVERCSAVGASLCALGPSVRRLGTARSQLHDSARRSGSSVLDGKDASSPEVEPRAARRAADVCEQLASEAPLVPERSLLLSLVTTCRAMILTFFILLSFPGK